MNHAHEAITAIFLGTAYVLFLIAYPWEVLIMTLVLLLSLGVCVVFACMNSSQISQDEERRGR